jgi:hypothetical protein
LCHLGGGEFVRQTGVSWTDGAATFTEASSTSVSESVRSTKPPNRPGFKGPLGTLYGDKKKAGRVGWPSGKVVALDVLVEILDELSQCEAAPPKSIEVENLAAMFGCEAQRAWFPRKLAGDCEGGK